MGCHTQRLNIRMKTATLVPDKVSFKSRCKEMSLVAQTTAAEKARSSNTLGLLKELELGDQVDQFLFLFETAVVLVVSDGYCNNSIRSP